MLEVDMKTTIKTLHRKGYNKTQIGQMLGIDRKAVRKVLREDAVQIPSPKSDAVAAPPKTGCPSMLDEYREYIEIPLAKDLFITRVQQDLQKEYGANCGYSVQNNVTPHITMNQISFDMIVHNRRLLPHVIRVCWSIPSRPLP